MHFNSFSEMYAYSRGIKFREPKEYKEAKPEVEPKEEPKAEPKKKKSKEKK